MKKAIKHGIRKLTRGIRVKIQAGPCKGFLWSATTRMNFIRGVYESPFANFIAATLRADDDFWDVGAHFGYYSLLGSRIVTQGKCYAFEPNADNRWYLEHHASWNHLKNTTIFSCALAATDGSRQFGTGGTGGGKLDAGDMTVQTRSVDSLVRAKECHLPSFMKIDIEGGETELLGSNFRLRENGMMCVATHGEEIHDDCRSILKQNGYQVHDLKQRSMLIASSGGRKISDEALRMLSAT